MTRYFFTSLTRISNLRTVPFQIEPQRREDWQTGDYVVGIVSTRPSPQSRVELSTGRTIEVMEGSLIIGALGKRYATLEAVGDWRQIEKDLEMDALGGGGMFGKLTSKSPFLPPLLSLNYQGHVMIEGRKTNMADYVPPKPESTYRLPTILIIGTSMSAGKTTTARTVISQLKGLGWRVVGAKLTGSGRFRDILGMRDAGADYIYDFVDVGLPSTVIPEEAYRQKLDHLLRLIGTVDADVGVMEIGSSPLEPYNGDVAIEAIAEWVRFTILCASDPYAVVGVVSAYGKKPDLVAGIATNTEAGIELVERLSGIKALNLMERESLWEFRDIFRAVFGTPPSNTGS